MIGHQKNRVTIRRQHGREIFLVAFYIIASVIPLASTGLTGFIVKTDSGFPFDLDGYFQRDISTYSKEVNFGNNSIHLVNFFRQKIELLPFFALYKLGMSIFAINRLAYVISFFLLMYGCYNMLTHCFKLDIRIRAAMGAYALYNPLLILTSVSAANWGYLISFSAIFYVMALLGKMAKYGSRKHVLPLAVWSIILVLNNYITVITCFAVIAIYVFSPSIAEPLIRRLRLLGSVALVFIASNLWLILPQIFSLVRERSITYDSQYTSMESSVNLNKSIYSQMSFRIWERQDIPLEVNRQYDSVVGVLFPIFLGMIVLFLVRRRERLGIWLLAFYLLLCFAAKGAAPPLGGIYGFLFKNMPLFSVYRDASHFLEIALCLFIILVAISANYYLEHCRTRAREAIFLATFSVLLLIESYPLLSGNLLGLLEESNIPKQYGVLKEFLSDKSCRIMFPGTEVYQTSVKYKWAPFESLDINSNYFNRPIVSTALSNANLNMRKATEELIGIENYQQLSKARVREIFENYRVQYVLLDPNIASSHPLYKAGYKPDIEKYRDYFARRGFPIYHFKGLDLVEMYKPIREFLEVDDGRLNVQKYPNVSVYRLSTERVRKGNAKLTFAYSFDSNWLLYSITERAFKTIKRSDMGFMQWDVGSGETYVLLYFPDILVAVGALLSVLLVAVLALKKADEERDGRSVREVGVGPGR